MPAEPFPNVNDRAEFQRRFNGVRAMSWGLLGVGVLAGLGLVWGALRLAGLL